MQSSINRRIRGITFLRGCHNEVVQAMKIPVLVLVAVARLCQAEVVIASSIPDQRTSDLVYDLITIVSSCYGDRTHGVGLAGDLPGNLLRRLSTEHLIPVAQIDNTRTFMRKGPHVPLQFRRKLQIFIVGASSMRQLANIIQMNVKYSIWWNHMASFLIIDWSPTCINTISFLGAAWQLNLLNAKVMCYGYKNRRIIANFNPFTSFAPVPWRKASIVKGKFGHPFTVFIRDVRPSDTVCLNLDFDKVKDCGGHPILANRPEWNTTMNEGQRSAYNFVSRNDRVFSTVFRALNAALRYVPIGTSSVDHGILTEDITSCPHWLYNSWDGGLVTYPFDQTGFGLVSQFRGNKSQLKKILTVVDIDTWIALAIAFFITVIFFKFVVAQALDRAFLNLVRITSGTGFEGVPRSNAPRMYLTGVLFLAVTMHGIFEGNLASLLTTVIPLRNVNTMRDVVDLDYIVYGRSGTPAILEQEMQARYMAVRGLDDCIRKVMDDKSAACLHILDGIILDKVHEFHLHLSPMVSVTYLVFPITWNWPYEERFNKLLSILVEADGLEPWDVKCSPVKLEDFQIDQDVKSNKKFKKMELGELLFAFVILGIGLVLATIVFIGELGMHYTYMRSRRMRSVRIGRSTLH